MNWGRPLAALIVITSWLSYAAAPSTARADQSYDELIHEAVREFDAANYVEARVLFERAEQIKPNARTSRALGYCDYELKHYVDAVRELTAALEDTRNPLTPKQRGDVEKTLEKAKRFIGQLVLETQPPDASIVLDGRPATGRKWTLDAGDHMVAASAPGYRSSDLRVSVAGGKDTHTRLQLTPVEVAPEQVARSSQPERDAPFGLQPAAAGPADAPRDSDSGGVLTKWWVWTAVGVVVVAGATVGTVLLLNQPEKPSAGSSGVILHPPALTSGSLSGHRDLR